MDEVGAASAYQQSTGTSSLASHGREQPSKGETRYGGITPSASAQSGAGFQAAATSSSVSHTATNGASHTDHGVGQTTCQRPDTALPAQNLHLYHQYGSVRLAIIAVSRPDQPGSPLSATRAIHRADLEHFLEERSQRSFLFVQLGGQNAVRPHHPSSERFQTIVNR